MKKNENSKSDRKSYVPVLLICITLLSIATVFCSVQMRLDTKATYNSSYKNAKAGTIADETIFVKSTVDITDDKATQERVYRAVRAVLPVFSIDTKETFSILREFEKYAESSSFSREVLNCSYAIIKDVLNQGFFDSADIDSFNSDGYAYIFENNTFSENKNYNGNRKTSDVLSDKNINEYLSEQLSEYGDLFSDTDKETIRFIVNDFLRPNIFYDELTTGHKRDAAAEDVKPVIVSLKKGEILIEKDKVITAQQVNTLELLTSQNSISWNHLAGIFVFCFICYSGIMLVFGYFSEKKHAGLRLYLVSMTLAMIINLAASYFCSFYASSFFTYDFQDAFMPVIFVPVLITLISTKKRLGYCASFITGVSFSVFPGASIYSFFYVCLCGCACVYLTQFITKRIGSLKQWIVSFFICCLITAVFIFIGSFSVENIISEMKGVFIIVTVSNLLMVIILPVLERVLNLPTVYRLHELAFSDSPLLTRLAQAAPGTYQHSCRVSELAAAAASEVGANPLIARVGGLYHDIGKTEHPEYFVENQQGGDNKHDDINPSLSASILKNHVSVGADKGRDAHLPQEIVNIIANHHGNDLIYYFYHEALKNQKNESDEVRAQDYSYNNSEIPDTKECAIVMLADSVEAAARTVVAPTPAKFSKLIHSIVLGKIERNQLNDSNLTMGDIETVEESFMKTLNALYHARIEYPDEEE